MYRRQQPGALGGVTGLATLVAGIVSGLRQKKDREKAEAQKDQERSYLLDQRDLARRQQELAERSAAADRLRAAAPYVAEEQGPELQRRAAQVAAGTLAENPALRGMGPGQQRVANVGADIALRGLGDASGQPLTRAQTTGDLYSGLPFTRTPELTKKADAENEWILDLLKKRLGQYPNAAVDYRQMYRAAQAGDAKPATVQTPVPVPLPGMGGAAVTVPTPVRLPNLLDFGDPALQARLGKSQDQINHEQALELQGARGQTQAYLLSLREASKRGDKTAGRKLNLFGVLLARGAQADHLPEYVDALVDHFDDTEIEHAIGGVNGPAGGQPGAPGGAGAGALPPFARPSLFGHAVTAPPEPERPGAGLAPMVVPPVSAQPVGARPSGLPPASSIFEGGKTAVQRTQDRRDGDARRKDGDAKRKDDDQLTRQMNAYIGVVKSKQFDLMSPEKRQQLASSINDIAGQLGLPVLPLEIDGRFTAKELRDFGIKDKRLLLEGYRADLQRAKQDFDARFRGWKERRDLPEGEKLRAQSLDKRIMEISQRIAWMQKTKHPDYGVIDALGKDMMNLYREQQGVTGKTEGVGSGPLVKLPARPDLRGAPQRGGGTSKGIAPRVYQLGTSARAEKHRVVYGGGVGELSIDDLIESMRKQNPRLSPQQAEAAAQKWIRENRVAPGHEEAPAAPAPM